MQVVSMTEARKNLKKIFDAVYFNNEEVIIHRKGRENVVIIPFEEYDTLRKMQKPDYMQWHTEELTKGMEFREWVENKKQQIDKQESDDLDDIMEAGIESFNGYLDATE